MAPKNNKRSPTPVIPQHRQHKQKTGQLQAITTEQALKTDESFYILFHFNPLPTVLTRQEDYIVINVNLAFLDYLGLKREDVVGHNLHEFSTVPKQFEKMAKEASIKNYEEEITLSTGEKKTMLTSTQRIQIEDMDAILSTFVDISERARSEEQIRLLGKERVSAELSERRRIAKLLHDDLQQRIFAIKMHLERLEDGFDKNNVLSAKEDFAKLDAWLVEAIALTRKLSTDLNPISMPGSSLPEVFAWLASEMKGQQGLEVKLETNGVSITLDNDLLTVVMQAVRELLFNVIKHSGDQQATVLVKETNDSLKVTVTDKGNGFDMKGRKNTDMLSSGLANIRQQLKLFRCDFELESIPNKGTRAIITIPIRSSDTES